MQQVHQLKCISHTDQKICTMELGLSTQLLQRALCPECLEVIKLDQPCSLKKLPIKAQEYPKIQLTMIQEKYNLEEKKINQIIKLLGTLRDLTTVVFDDFIKNAEKISKKLFSNLEAEQRYYQNLTENLSITKLEELANLLSGSKKRESLISLDREECSQFNQQLQANFIKFKTSAQDQINGIKRILSENIATTSWQQSYMQLAKSVEYDELQNFQVNYKVMH